MGTYRHSQAGGRDEDKETGHRETTHAQGKSCSTLAVCPKYPPTTDLSLVEVLLRLQDQPSAIDLKA
jgi:hypothetical protein